MSTPAVPSSRGRLALALTAAAAAAAPASASATSPVTTTRAERSSLVGEPQALAPAPPGAPAAAAPPVNVQFSAAPASASLHLSAPAATSTAAPDDATALEPAADLELVKFTAARGGARLTFDASHDGFLRVKWSADGESGTITRPILSGYQQLALPVPTTATHVKLRAALLPADDTARTVATGSFRMRR